MRKCWASQKWLLKSFRAEGWRSLFYGWEERATSTGGDDFGKPCIHNGAFARDKTLSFHEHLAANAWDPGSKPISSDDTLAFSKKIYRNGCSPLRTSGQSSVSYILSALLVWVPRVTSGAKSSQSHWHSIHQKLMTCHQSGVFISCWCPLYFFFFVIPDSSSLRSDIANYFKLSGRQFSISIKSRLLPPTLGRGNGGLCSQPRNSYGCHLRRNLNSIFSPTSEDTRWVHPLVKTQVCSLYVFQ